MRKIFKVFFTLIITVSLIGAVISQAAPATGTGPIVKPETPIQIVEPSSSVSVEANSAVYVDEGMPTANYNAYDQNNLKIGRGAEFGYSYQTLIKFNAQWQSNGGNVPDDAQITGGYIKFYKENAVSGEINVHKLISEFNESTVTWDSKPGLVAGGGSAGIIATTDLPSNKGWCFINIDSTIVRSWLDNPTTNCGIAIIAKWNDYKSMIFRSDEFAGSRPTLVITYKGASTPPPEEPNPVPADSEPCALTYAVNPPTPKPGEEMTITVRATDNQALSHVSILRGYTELAREEATGSSQTELEVSYTETAVLPGMNYTLIADDIGEAAPCREDITVPVRGTSTEPEVNIEAEFWGVERVLPARFRLIEGDEQAVVLNVTASDPEGIQRLTVSINGIDHDYTYEGIQTSVSQRPHWVNSDPSRTTFSFSARAQDREGYWSSTETVYYDISQLEDIRLLWSSVPPFDNYSTNRLTWTRMVQVFGKDECWWVESWGWKSPKAWAYYHLRFKDVADGGCCFGFSTMATELHNGRISPSEIEYPRAAYQFIEGSSYNKQYIEARQAAQLGESVMVERISQRSESDDRDTPTRLLRSIERDLLAGTPGVLCISEGDRGHALVPWMTKLMNDGKTRVYVYDCNKVEAVRNASADINDTNHYPYIEIDDSGFNYQFNSTDVWNDKMYYFTYEQVIGNSRRLNRLGSTSDAPQITDQSIPSIGDMIIAVFSGDADIYFEDKQGRITGIHSGKIKEEIPGSIPIMTIGGTRFADQEMYILPADIKLATHVVGLVKGEYSLGLINGEALYAVENKSTQSGSKDIVAIEPHHSEEGYKLTMFTDCADKDFTIRFANTFPGRVEALGTDYIGKEFILEHLSTDKGDRFSSYVKKGGKGIVVEGDEGAVTFDAVLKSTESADTVEPDQTEIPEERTPDVTVSKGEIVEIKSDTLGEVVDEAPELQRQIRLAINKATAIVDGEEYTLDAAPFINASTNRTLVPVRFVSEVLGAEVNWLAKARQVEIKSEGKTILLTIESDIVLIDGVKSTIDSPAEIVGSRTFVPLRFVSETLGANVQYIAETREIIIVK